MSVRIALLPLIASMAFFTGQFIHVAPPVRGAKPPEASQPVPTDYYGDPLPKGARFRLGTMRLRHDAAVEAVAWQPDGRALATADSDHIVRLWQIPGGKQLAKWDKMKAVVFSADGRSFACLGKDATIRFVDLATGKELRRLSVPKSIVSLVAVSPDGKFLAADDQETGVYLYAAHTGKKVRILEGQVFLFLSVVFSSDGRTLAASADGAGDGVHCWDTGTGKKLQTLARDAGVSSLALSPDGKLLAATMRERGRVTVYLWTWPGGKELRRIDAEDHEPHTLAFSPDGKILAASGGGSIRLYDSALGGEVGRFEGHVTEGWHLAFSPDGSLLASAGGDGVVTVWERRTKKAPRPLTGVGHRLNAVAMTGDGRLLLTHARDGALTLWDGRKGGPLRTVDHWRRFDGTLILAPDGSKALALPWFGDRAVGWDLGTGRRLPALPRLSPYCACAAFSPDATMLALGSSDGTIHLCETANGEKFRRLRGEKAAVAVSNLAWSPDGRTLVASYENGRLLLWDLNANYPHHRLPGGGQTTLALAISSDSRLLAAAWEKDRVIHLVEMVSGQEVRQFRGHPTSIPSLAFAPDSRTLASGGCSDVDRAYSVRHPFPSGSSKPAIRLWDVPSGKQIRLLPGHQGNVLTLAFSSDGANLISGSNDDTVLSWDVADATRRRPAGKELSTDKLSYLWTDLASKDAARAQRAVADLIQAPDSALPYLAKALPPVPPVKMAPIVAWIADLDHEQFTRRERASQELEKVGEPAAPALRKALKEKPSLEMRRRITALLEAIDAQTTSPEWLRTIRALQALESIDTPKASRILEGLARGAPEARLTEEAKASLQRLVRRSAKP